MTTHETSSLTTCTFVQQPINVWLVQEKLKYFQQPSTYDALICGLQGDTNQKNEQYNERKIEICECKLAQLIKTDIISSSRQQLNRKPTK